MGVRSVQQVFMLCSVSMPLCASAGLMEEAGAGEQEGVGNHGV